ncbi:hypothetical protein OpiT1DRAFT_05583, partial [Opitutaceae bacterium TAV1]
MTTKRAASVPPASRGQTTARRSPLLPLKLLIIN